MLQNAYLLAKVGADTAENEQHFAEILPKLGNYPTDRADKRSSEEAADRTTGGADGLEPGEGEVEGAVPECQRCPESAYWEN